MKSRGGNIPGGNFLVGKFLGGNSTGGSLIGENFLGRSFSEKLLRGNLLEYDQSELTYCKLHGSGILLAVLSHTLYKVADNF